MKTNFMKKVAVMIVFIMAIALVSNFSYAASSVTIAAGTTSLTVGSSTTLTIKANNVTGRINISSSNPGVISISSSSEWVENGSVTIRATANAAGSAYITVSSADTSDSSTGEPVTVSAGVNLTAKAVVVDTRSSNNYLSSLNVDGYELSPAFDANTNNYTMNVGYDVSSINVSGIPADTKSRTVVEGNLDLVAGENNVTVTVTAENGYKRVYTITVTKDKNPDDIDATIESLVINNATLKNEFKSDVYEYMCEDITADVEKLEFNILTKIPDLKYEIIGNDELKQGINHVIIKVTSRDGSETKEYEIIVFKTDEVLALEEIETTIADVEKVTFLDRLKNIKYELMIVVGLLLLLIILIIVITLKKKKSKNISSTESEEVEEEEKVEIPEEVGSNEIEEDVNDNDEDNDIVKEEILNEEKVESNESKVRKGSIKNDKKSKSKKVKLNEELSGIEEIDVTLDLPNLNDNNDEK